MSNPRTHVREDRDDADESGESSAPDVNPADAPQSPAHARIYEPVAARVLAYVFLGASAVVVACVPGIYLADACRSPVSAAWLRATQCPMGAIAVAAALAWLALPRVRVAAGGTAPRPRRPRRALALPRDVVLPHAPDAARWRPLSRRNGTLRILAVLVVVVAGSFLLFLLFVIVVGAFLIRGL